jgi:PPM family protein phosphatase
MGWFDWLRRRAPETGARLRIVGAMLSDIGRVRTNNEDATMQFADARNDLVAAVADGMGGHAAGEVASGLALASVRRALEADDSTPPRALAAALRVANRAIRDYAREHPETVGMGTTCTVALVRGGLLWIGHVGDSRAYLLRDGILTQLTEDHTLQAQRVREGLLAPGETDESGTGHWLMHALGAADAVEPMTPAEGLAMQAGDALLLCSAGCTASCAKARSRGRCGAGTRRLPARR